MWGEAMRIAIPSAQSHPAEESPRSTVEPSAEMSIEIFSKRHLSVLPLPDAP
jgi:hypothetical protein